MYVSIYFTIPIYRFRMKCHLCVNHIEMQTDPANCDYVIVSGARRKEERWDMKDNDQILTTEHEEKKKLETDPMYKLEHGVGDQEKLKIAVPTLSNIQEMQSAWKDDFAINSMLRKKFRVRLSWHIYVRIVKQTLLQRRETPAYEDKQRMKRKEITSRPWFASPQVAGDETLKKLGLSKVPTPKSLNSPNGFAASDLGIIRRKSGACSAIQKQQPLLVSRDQDSRLEVGSRIDQRDQAADRTSQESESSLRGEAGFSLQTETVMDSDANTSSLVADYSDSSSDADIS
ncbi:hypothetical protein scyTo_0021865 [Scyliorhinus torazame]|uniref:Probable splicing factor YJU2B n=1 Tax=Scyliorhinus torazame TaxID=75743 RepID=A0A401Q8E7_SCYTO|nr:hypothetical protein [Scyliorhinus torazame]